jgi:acetyltransferase-like isoleucine patch superfamily enzyme
MNQTTRPAVASLRQSALVRGFKRARMALIRWRMGLRHVHPTFHCLDGNAISPDLVTGAYSYIGRRCWICPRVTMGRYVMVASEVVILGGDHRFDVPGTPMMFSGRPAVPPTTIEDDVWIGYRVAINAGVRVGRGSIIAAHAVVTQDVPPYTIVGGVPARPIGHRFATEREIAEHDRMLSGPTVHGTLSLPKDGAEQSPTRSDAAGPADAGSVPPAQDPAGAGRRNA